MIMKGREPPAPPYHMLLTIGLVLALTSALILSRVMARGPVNSSQAGWMSDQWLAEHRATHPG